MGHELIHLLEGDFERTIDPAQLFQQLLALVVVAAGEEEGEEEGKGWNELRTMFTVVSDPNASLYFYAVI